MAAKPKDDDVAAVDVGEGSSGGLREGMIVSEVNEKLLWDLEKMGFPKARASRALHYSGNSSVEAAANWIVEHENDPDIDEMPSESDLHTKRTGHAEFADRTLETVKPISLEAPKPKDDDVTTEDVGEGSSSGPQEDMVVPEVNEKLLADLEEMGFAKARATRALHHSGNSSAEGAANWINEHENDPDIDEMPLFCVVDSQNATTSASHHLQTQNATTSTSSLNPTTSIIIPGDLFVQILLRLPVKYLLRLKTLSELHDLISSPNFIKAHLLKSINNPNLTHHHVMMTSIPPFSNLRHCSLPSLIHTEVPPFEVDYPMKHPRRSVLLIGSVNGLICLAIEEFDVFLWNPTLRKSKAVPRSGLRQEQGRYLVHGFGYESSNDDYKVVEISCDFQSASVYQTKVQIYSRNSDSWRRIEGSNCLVPVIDSGKFVNGKLHWAAVPVFGLPDGWTIVSLDMGDETYGQLEQPDYGEGQFYRILGLLGGWVCVFCDHHVERRVDMWVMKEYGVRESWIKMFNFSYANNPMFMPPYILVGSRKLLLVDRSRFLLYDPDDGSQRYVGFNGNGFDAWLGAVVYVESLVSPINDAEGI